MIVGVLESMLLGNKIHRKRYSEIGCLLDNEFELCNYVKDKLWNWCSVKTGSVFLDLEYIGNFILLFYVKIIFIFRGIEEKEKTYN